jgi:hypothetical protein
MSNQVTAGDSASYRRDVPQTKRARRSQAKIKSQTPPLAHSFKRAGELLDISASTIRNEVIAGRLVAVKRGKSALILHEDLLAYVRSLPRLVLGNPK